MVPAGTIVSGTDVQANLVRLEQSIDDLREEVEGSTYNAAAVSVYKSGNQTLTTATETLITFDSEELDSGDMHDTSSNTSRLVCRVPGIYLIFTSVTMANNSAGGRYSMVRKNAAGSAVGGSLIGYGTDEVASINFGSIIAWGPRLLKMVPGDYVELFAYQSSGGDLTLNGGASATIFGMFRIPS